MAYNFKSIADVEVITEPAESANVLIEENGIIKKTPKSAIGGAGGAGGVGGLSIVYDGNNNNTILYASENLYETVMNALTSYQMPHISLYDVRYDEYANEIYVSFVNRIRRNLNNSDGCIALYFGSYNAYIYPDGRINVSYYD